MKAKQVVVTAFVAIVGAISAQAHGVDPDEKIVVACARDSMRMGAITSAMKTNHYWAPQTVRRQMLSLAQQACARGATVVSFVPPADQRWCQAAPTWSTLCVDQAAAVHEAANSSVMPSSSVRE